MVEEKAEDLHWLKCTHCGFIHLCNTSETLKRCPECNIKKWLEIDKTIWICNDCLRWKVSKKEPICDHVYIYWDFVYKYGISGGYINRNVNKLLQKDNNKIQE